MSTADNFIESSHHTVRNAIKTSKCNFLKEFFACLFICSLVGGDGNGGDRMRKKKIQFEICNKTKADDRIV